MENPTNFIKRLPLYTIAAGIETRRYYERKLTIEQKEFVENVIGAIGLLLVVIALAISLTLKHWVIPFVKTQWRIFLNDCQEFHAAVKYGYDSAEAELERNFSRQDELIAEAILEAKKANYAV